jgi:hypothetical protein
MGPWPAVTSCAAVSRSSGERADYVGDSVLDQLDCNLGSAVLDVAGVPTDDPERHPTAWLGAMPLPPVNDGTGQFEERLGLRGREPDYIADTKHVDIVAFDQLSSLGEHRVGLDQVLADLEADGKSDLHAARLSLGHRVRGREILCGGKPATAETGSRSVRNRCCRLVRSRPVKIDRPWVFVLLRCGAPEGIRTPNLLIRSQMLYPLSYGRSALPSYMIAKRGGSGIRTREGL